MLRFAAPEDAQALLAVYGQYIDTSVTFEYVLPTCEEFRGRIEDISREYPYLVWEESGVILGYAYAHRFHERAAYQWCAELSVYLDERAHGRGLGKKLYTALMDILRVQGVKNVYGCITVPNDKSIALHKALGFELVSRFHSAGYKAGAWHDVVWYEKSIAPETEPPAPIKSVRDIPAAALADILSKTI